MAKWLVLLALANAWISNAGRLTEQHSWYHTSSDISAELRQLSANCTGAKLSVSTRSSAGGAPSAELDVVHISRIGVGHGGQKAFFVFGEHARELISPESALHLAHILCGNGDKADRELVEQALKDTTFVLIPNANPLGRKQVEMGQYCKRTNENGVDLNRNWDDIGDRPADSTGLDTEINPGPHAFSEPETRLLRDILLEEKPDVFLSVHSGAYLLGTPTAAEATTGVDTQSQAQLTDTLARISQDFCNGDCPFGDLTEVIGYKSQGCDIDYVKNHTSTPYAFTWEIYANSDIRQFFAEKAHAQAEGRDMNSAAQMYFSMKSLMFLQKQANRRVRSQLRGRAGSLVSSSPDDADNDDCFAQFNPSTQAETEEVVSVWGRAFLTLCNELRSLHGLRQSPN